MVRAIRPDDKDAIAQHSFTSGEQVSQDAPGGQGEVHHPRGVQMAEARVPGVVEEPRCRGEGAIEASAGPEEAAEGEPYEQWRLHLEQGVLKRVAFRDTAALFTQSWLHQERACMQVELADAGRPLQVLPARVGRKIVCSVLSI